MDYVSFHWQFGIKEKQEKVVKYFEGKNMAKAKRNKIQEDVLQIPIPKEVGFSSGLSFKHHTESA